MEFIDIHGHYAWDVDDGITSQEEALAALKQCQSQNITKIVATPHITPGTTTKQEFETIKNRINELKALAKPLGIAVYSGCEIMLNRDYLQALDDLTYLTINKGPYVLVEFNVTRSLPDDFDERIYEYALKHQVIIAHIERYFHHQLKLDIIKQWLDYGYVLQINSTSILNSKGNSHEFAMELLEKGLVHVIGNDVHQASGARSPNLKATYDYLCQRYREDEIRKLMYDNPLALINGQKVAPVKVQKIKASRISWFKRRK